MENITESKRELCNFVSFSKTLIISLMVLGVVGGTLSVLPSHGVLFSNSSFIIKGGLTGIIFILMDIVASTGLLYILKSSVSAYGKPMDGLMWWLISCNLLSAILEGINSNLTIPFESIISAATLVLWIIVAIRLTKNYGKNARVLGNIIFIMFIVSFCYFFLKGSYLDLLTGWGENISVSFRNILSFTDIAIPMLFNIVLYLSIGLTLIPRQN